METANINALSIASATLLSELLNQLVKKDLFTSQELSAMMDDPIDDLQNHGTDTTVQAADLIEQILESIT